jgi:hypothetical protein
MNQQTQSTTGQRQATTAGTPKKGDRFRCAYCGMSIEITADCRCQDPGHVALQCCGQPLEKV